jgi:ribosomal protein S12 methylthiotransferase
MGERAASFVGRSLSVLVERLDVASGRWSGRSHREAPEVDGEITFTTSRPPSVGDYVDVLITGNEGADLRGEAVS